MSNARFASSGMRSCGPEASERSGIPSLLDLDVGVARGQQIEGELHGHALLVADRDGALEVLHPVGRGRDDDEVDDMPLEDLGELVERSEHLPRQFRRGRAVEHEPGELVTPVRARQERLVQVEREVVGPHDRERPRVVPAAPHCVRDEPDDDPAATEERPRDDEIDADEEPRDVVLVQEEAGRSDEQRLHADRARTCGRARS